MLRNIPLSALPGRNWYARFTICLPIPITSSAWKPIWIASSQVTVASHFATAASKTVSRTENPENTATSKTDAQSIYIHTDEDKVNYTLSVSCFDMTSSSGAGGFQKLVLIDNLPEPGDHNTFDNAQPRHSDFKVSLASDSQITVSVKDKDGVVTPLDFEAYILRFSTETSFEEAGTSDAKSGAAIGSVAFGVKSSHRKPVAAYF